jgi:DNA-binding MarR family transcriptional regulator
VAQASELVVRLEATFRTLGKRIYLPSMRRLRALHPTLDKVSFPLLAALEFTEGLRPSDLAAAVDLDLSTVSRHLSQLEQLGLVSRRPDGDDRRASRISLTPVGHESLRTVLAVRAELLDSVLMGWSDHDRGQLLALLDRLLAGVANQATTINQLDKMEKTA